MRLTDVLATALRQIRANKLRSFFTLLGIIVSVAFLIAVVAIIQGMNAYVRENVAGAVVGTNAFQVRRTPIQVGLIDDEQLRLVQRRPLITHSDGMAVGAAIPNAIAVSLQASAPTPLADVVWHDRTLGDVQILGATADYQTVQDYRFTAGRPLTETDVRDRRPVVVIGAEVAERLFEQVNPVGRDIRILGDRFNVVGVVAKKGRVLGQSFDAFALMPLSSFESLYGRRRSITVSVKLADAIDVAPAMGKAEEAMRVAHRLRPREANDFSVETGDALVSFWESLTRVLFLAIPAVVCIGVLVGGIVIMNIMLMAVNERTHEIGLRKAVGARQRDIQRQFLAEAILLALLGSAAGVASGWLGAVLVAAVSPLPAQVTAWSVALAVLLSGGVGVLFGVYPATRAARLAPVTAMRPD
jgi:putative ABC transport system permease protein